MNEMEQPPRRRIASQGGVSGDDSVDSNLEQAGESMNALLTAARSAIEQTLSGNSEQYLERYEQQGGQ